MPEIRLRPVAPADLSWVRSLLTGRWGAPEVVTRGILHHADALPGYVAFFNGLGGSFSSQQAAGLVTFRIDGGSCEIVTLDSLHPNLGIGSMLLAAVREHASAAGCRRLWLITTNDNTHALRFYQKRGLVLAALHRDAIKASRGIKPGIPERGNDGIPIRDEIELEMKLPG
jgi:GNAT superfamily N-acetyltransferase